MRAFPPFRSTPPPVRRPVPRFEARPTLTAGTQLVCRACGGVAFVQSWAEGEAWALRGCPHTVPEPVGGVADLLGKTTTLTPAAGVGVELLRAAGVR